MLTPGSDRPLPEPGRPPPRRHPRPDHPPAGRHRPDPPGPARAAVTALLAFHPLRASEIRQLTLDDAHGLDDGRLHLPGRTGARTPVRLPRPPHKRWPHTANPHFFVTSRTALSTVPASRPWRYRHYPASSHLLRSDRILDEVHAAGGDVRMLCELFGLSIQAATRYTAAGDFPPG